MRRKRKRAPGAGRPVGTTTTGLDATPRVSFALSADQRAALDARAVANGRSGGLEAKAIVLAALFTNSPTGSGVQC